MSKVKIFAILILLILLIYSIELAIADDDDDDDDDDDGPGPGPGPTGDDPGPQSDGSSSSSSSSTSSGDVTGDGICGPTETCANEPACGSCPPPCSGSTGSSCGCGSCGCGGSVQCDGSCSGGDPTPSNYGSACGNGGSILCGGSCSNSCSGSTGSPCGNGGTIQCDGSCSNLCYANQGYPCSCDSCGCGGVWQCNGACSGSPPAPSNFGSACGNGGTIQCSGACSSPCSGNTGSACGNCGGTITCAGSCSIGTPFNFGSACGNCGTIDCSSNCINQGPCSPGQTQCSSSKYQTCTGGCQWQNAGTDADNDGVDVQCQDATCDNAKGVCDSAVQGSCIAKTPSESNCADLLDNNCNGKTDCQDADCAGSISGSIKDSNAQPIPFADVSAKIDVTPVKSASTNQQGSYSIGINCGTYNLAISHPDYAPKTKSNVNVPPKQQVTADFNLVLGTSCESDCTFAADSIVHASCDGKNGCTFFDSTSKAACDNSKTGWFRDYNSTHFVTCASGSPQPKTEIQASVGCSSGTLVKVTRIVTYNGKPVKLVIATCG